ncbi:MAG TPA: class I SAM-dependent methyltransferase [Candidatus Elarobacter sp.]|jgi:SAM-dependent methyltransferase|nr:class I SAM-dependent methyltransferase [Candidatus Elarobacter sp.]
MAGRRAGQRFDAELGVTTEALLFLGELDPEAVGPSIEHATHYSPTPVAEASALLDASPLAPERATFVDVGAGLGRVVLLAARRPYRAVIGVEISPALAEVARENLNVARDARRVVRDVRIVRADAASFAFPRGDLVVYLFNPFTASVLGRVVATLLATRAGREVVLLYHTPVERDAIEATGAFAVVADLGFGVVYRLAPS